MIKKLFLFLFALLAIGMAVPSTRAEIQNRAIKPVLDNIGARIAPGRLRAMADQLDVRLGRGEGLPSGFDGWLRREGRAEAIGKLLGVPDEKIVRILLPIGVPAEDYKQPEKMPFNERACFNKYGS